jgi:putative membrane protein
VTQPALHALLNGTSAVLLLLGWLAITGRGPWRAARSEAVHKRFMLGAVTTSAVFLASYVHYHYNHGSTPFWGDGWLRTVYLLVLVPHVLLAMVMVPMILTLLWAAAKGRFERHKRLARWTLPIWWYVSVTGVVIYLMLYRMDPALS